MSEESEWTNGKEYTSDAAAELAALTSIHHDLRYTIRACELVLERTASDSLTPASEAGLDEHVMIQTSLWDAALIRYARCFGSGVRSVRLSTNMFDGLGAKAGEALKAHEYFLDQRNKHVAHSVNRLEDVRVVLLVGDGVHKQKEILGCGPFHMRKARENPENVRTLKSLAVVLEQQVKQQFYEKLNQVLDEARALDGTQLAALPDMEIPVPVEISEVGKRRKC